MTENYIQKLMSLDILDMSEEEFVDWVTFLYGKIAGSRKCEVVLSANRCAEAHTLIRRDLVKLLDEMNGDNGTTLLDEYKCAAYVTYWLRRRLIINSCFPIPTPIPGLDPSKVTPVQEDFLSCSSELCSFLIGVIYCRHRHEHSAESINDHAMIKPEYIQSVARLLKEKNVSPHALFIIFKTLFDSANKS